MSIHLSVVIPTFNSASTIGACLRSLGASADERVEVIVVDQSSDDGTPDIARTCGAMLVSRPQPQFYSAPSASRNLGAELARGELLYHLDSDMEVQPGLLPEIIGHFGPSSDLVGLIVPERDRAGRAWSRFKAYERSLYLGDDRFEAARVVRSSTFRDIGGYDESLASGEDWDLHVRIAAAGPLARCRSTVLHDMTSLTLRGMLTKKYNYGKSARAYFRKHGASGRSILSSQLRLLVGPGAREHPGLAAGAVVLKLMEFTAGALGMAVGSRSSR